MNVFILEDDSIRMKSFQKRFMHDNMHHAWRVEEAVRIVTSESKFDHMTLDHDLGEDHYGGNYADKNTGLDFVRFLVQEVPKEKWPDTVTVHSYNSERGRQMVEELRAAGITSDYSPFRPEP